MQFYNCGKQNKDNRYSRKGMPQAQRRAELRYRVIKERDV